MGKLTDHCPKPLLRVAGSTLIEHTIRALVAAHINDIVVNVSYLSEQIIGVLGDGASLGARIQYSPEPDGALETGGGILKALPLLGTEPFIAVNADVYSDLNFTRLELRPEKLAHLILVPNPEHHPDGDFCIDRGLAGYTGQPRWTFAGIGVYRPELWNDCQPGRFRLPPLLRTAMDRHAVSAEVFNGVWADIGTAARLAALNADLTAR